MKRIFLAVLTEENGKYYAFVLAIRTGENIKPFINRYNADIFHLCESRKQAAKIVTSWNALHKVNGTYLFDYPAF